MKSKEVGNRIREFMDARDITQMLLAEKIGVPQSNISAMLLGKRNIDDLVKCLENEFGLESGYFTKGVNYEGKVSENGKPHFISVAHAGLLTAEQGQDYEMQPVIAQLPKYDYTVEVRGNSMAPEYRSGDIVACLDVTKSTFIQWGNAHLLNTSQGVVIKKVFDAGDCVKCVSVNESEYPEYKIPKSEIYSIGLIVGSLRIG